MLSAIRGSCVPDTTGVKPKNGYRDTDQVSSTNVVDVTKTDVDCLLN